MNLEMKTWLKQMDFLVSLNILKNYLFLLIVILILIISVRCNINIISHEPANNKYKTKHFNMFYDSTLFNHRLIEQIGVIKEQLFKHVKNYLECNYSGCIDVFITEDISNSYVDINGTIYESPLYSTHDKGNKIAQVVLTRNWGRSTSLFLSEGIANACEIFDSIGNNAFEYYKNYNSKFFKLDVTLIDTLMNRMKQEIIENGAFEYSYEEKERAGAFLHYLKEEYGLKNLKQWYCFTVYNSNDRVEEFNKIFGLELDSVIAHFSAKLINKR